MKSAPQMTGSTFAFGSDFGFGAKVHSDGDHGVTGTVIGFCFYPHGAQVQVSWWNNGALVEQWIADWRLEKAAQ